VDEQRTFAEFMTPPDRPAARFSKVPRSDF